MFLFDLENYLGDFGNHSSELSITFLPDGDDETSTLGNSFYGGMGIEDYNFEDQYGHIYKELIANIAPQYEDKDRFGFGTNKHLPTYKDK